MNTKFYKKEACNKQYKQNFSTHNAQVQLKIKNTAQV